MAASAEKYIESLTTGSGRAIPGWLSPVDGHLLVAVDRIQCERDVNGDVLEIGVYHGKCAILLGYFPRAHERIVVCDLFAGDEGRANTHPDESLTNFGDLTSAGFRENYRHYHANLPVVHAISSENLSSVMEPGSCRLVHIDGNHAYEAVRGDLRLTRELLGRGGVVVVDDWSSAHLPGVAMALWEEYARGELVPLALSGGKFYATWDVSGLGADDVDEMSGAFDQLSPGGSRRLGAHSATYYRRAGHLV